MICPRLNEGQANSVGWHDLFHLKTIFLELAVLSKTLHCVGLGSPVCWLLRPIQPIMVETCLSTTPSRAFVAIVCLNSRSSTCMSAKMWTQPVRAKRARIGINVLSIAFGGEPYAERHFHSPSRLKTNSQNLRKYKFRLQED